MVKSPFNCDQDTVAFVNSQVLPLIPEHGFFIEPFLEKGSLFFNKPRVQTNLLNVADKETQLALQYIRTCPKEFIERIYDIAPHITDVEQLNYLKVRGSELDNAVVWFCLNRCAIDGYDSFETWSPYVRELSETLQGVRITSDPLERLLANISTPAFLYFDSPYRDVADKEKALLLYFEMAMQLKENSQYLNFILKYDGCPLVKEMFDWVEFSEEKLQRQRRGNTHVYPDYDKSQFICW